MEKRLRIEFTGEDGPREKLNFQTELTHHTIGWADDTAKKYRTLVDIFIDDLDTHEQLSVRNALEHRSNWSGVGPICGYHEEHGPTVAAYARASRLDHIWRCTGRGCGWQESVLGSGFMPLMDFNNQLQRAINDVRTRREDPGEKIWEAVSRNPSGRTTRSEALWLEALHESQRYFNKKMGEFDHIADAMTHMRTGGQVAVSQTLMNIDYSQIEARLLEIFRHSLQTGEELVVAMKDKVHEPMKHVLPLEYFEARKQELRSQTKNQSFALGVYKPWESMQMLKKRLAEMGFDDLPKEERYRLLYGGNPGELTDYEKSRPLKTNEPNPAGQIPRNPEKYRMRMHVPIQGSAADVQHAIQEMVRRGVKFDREVLEELERKIAIDTETSGQNPMVAHNPAYDMKVLEDQGFYSLNKKLEEQIAEFEGLRKLFEEQSRELNKLRQEQLDQKRFDEHIKLLDDIFMFFAGLNLQDHAVAEQRKYLELMRKFKTLMLDLKEVLKPT